MKNAASTDRRAGLRWHECGYHEAKYVNTKGRILGEARKFIGSDYYAMVNGTSLGNYISFEDAKAAVEREVSNGR